MQFAEDRGGPTYKVVKDPDMILEKVQKNKIPLLSFDMAQTQGVDSAAIVPDDVTDDTDSSLGDDLQSSTASVSSSILNYRRENGRTYHAYKDGKYALPNDEAENERLDLQHNLFLLTFDDKLGLAPPNSPGAKVKHVLDIGTGTGIWAIDYADEHPESQTCMADVPPNVNFVIDDIEDEWTYSQPFDYIHSRVMTSCIADWGDYLAKCFNNLAPGGYVEIQEVDINIKSDDGSLSPDNIMLKSLALLKEASVMFGRPYLDILSLEDIMKNIGFEDVVVERFKWPINSWPRDKKAKLLGSWCYTNMACGLEAFTMAPLTRAHGWAPEEVNLWLVHQRKAMADRNTHAYWPLYSIYGRKPSKEN
ncbi:S-adenosyl-L-methionine-dependent methyltransferase [Fusarium redolens]|uniref:S-adenosyl-L-methionine-dependent methyltransferase n=1 Tax=Fusarium redolens TaxID=48865 RepID=A0A9P9HAQ9_FUSRE|nr:S-adenosyl-L-methionine-dependent methyltransferase [Fusarium redolens]KAH7253806.1 S-adenosyl-L-methionine-dependent methyltransferase [Fusarium redolens]